MTKSQHDPDLESFRNRLEKFLTVNELIEELTKWRASFPERGERRVVVQVEDEMGTWLSGIAGVGDWKEDGPLFPEVKLFRLFLEGEE